MDTRHFELQDLLSTALIALEAGDRAAVERALRRALAWVEADWLATPGELRPGPSAPPPAAAAPADGGDEDDDTTPTSSARLTQRRPSENP